MKIKVKFRKGVGDVPEDLNIERAGVAVSEGCLAIYPNLKKGDCTMYPLDLIAEILIEEDVEQEPTPIRRSDA